MRGSPSFRQWPTAAGKSLENRRVRESRHRATRSRPRHRYGVLPAVTAVVACAAPATPVSSVYVTRAASWLAATGGPVKVTGFDATVPLAAMRVVPNASVAV